MGWRWWVTRGTMGEITDAFVKGNPSTSRPAEGGDLADATVAGTACFKALILVRTTTTPYS